jgi:hypothetical protein
MDLRKHPAVSKALHTLQAGDRLGASTPAWAASVARTLLRAKTLQSALLTDAEVTRSAKTKRIKHTKTTYEELVDDGESDDEDGSDQDEDEEGEDEEEDEEDESDEEEDEGEGEEDASTASDKERARQRRKRGNPKPKSRAVLEGDRFLAALKRGFRPSNKIVVEPASVGRERTLTPKEARNLALGMAALHFRSGK